MAGFRVRNKIHKAVRVELLSGGEVSIERGVYPPREEAPFPDTERTNPSISARVRVGVLAILPEPEAEVPAEQDQAVNGAPVGEKVEE